MMKQQWCNGDRGTHALLFAQLDDLGGELVLRQVANRGELERHRNRYGEKAIHQF